MYLLFQHLLKEKLHDVYQPTAKINMKQATKDVRKSFLTKILNERHFKRWFVIKKDEIDLSIELQMFLLCV